MATKCPKCQSDNPETATFCADCGTRLSLHEGVSVSVTKTLISPAAEGSLVAGKYRILGKLGEGGMGVVYKAEDTRLKRTVALKFMPPELTRDPEAKERFIREAQAAAALSHPNICTIYEVDEEEGKSFISMEHVEGQSVRERIKKGRLDLAEALGIAIQAAQGLEEAHKKGIIHRDIKSANIMVTGSGQAKVMDFGLAKVFGASLITKEAKTMGTVAYMSPEQARGDAVDQRTDVWSLGVVLYEMLTGQLPFKGEFEQSMMHSILNHEPEPLSKVRPNLQRALENVVLTALTKNPTHRFQSMGELLEDLKAVAQGLKPLKAKPGLLRGRILGIRTPVFCAALVTLAVAAAFVVFSVLIPSARTGVLDSVAILPIINETGDAEREYFANSLTRHLNAELYKVAALTVPPAESIMTFKGSDKPRKKIAQELRVKAVVEVSWLQVGSRHRLIYTLSDPFRNKVIAADTLEREGEDILYLQSEFARAVVAAVKVAVTPAEQMLLAGGQKIKPEAYDLLMRAIEGYRGSDPETLTFEQIIEWARKAIEIDPDFALAHAWLAYFYSDGIVGAIEDEKALFPKAWEAVEKAIAIDNNLAEAFSTRGCLKLLINWDFVGAEQDFHKALALVPGDMWIPIVYEGFFLSQSGRADEAIESVKRRMETRNPVGFEVLQIGQQVKHFLWAGRYYEALEESKKIPSTDFDQLWLGGLAKALTGAPDEALDNWDRIKHYARYDSSFVRRDHAWILALAGRRDDAFQAMEEHIAILAQKNIDTSYDQARVYAGLGEKDKAFELLTKSYDNHSSQMLSLVADWALHSLHGDPRFEELAKKVGFPIIPNKVQN